MSDKKNIWEILNVPEADIQWFDNNYRTLVKEKDSTQTDVILKLVTAIRNKFFDYTEADLKRRDSNGELEIQPPSQYEIRLFMMGIKYYDSLYKMIEQNG